MNSSIKGSENKALKAGGWYVFSSIVVKGIAILSTPIFTRLMSNEEYGYVSAFLSWYTLLLPFCTVNLDYSIGRAKLDFPDQLDHYIGTMQVLSAVITFILGVICCFFFELVSGFMGFDPATFFLLLAYLFFMPAILFWQNGYRYRYLYKQNIAIAIYTAVSSVILSVALICLLDGNRVHLRIIGIVAPVCLLSVLFWAKALYRRQVHFRIEYWKYGLSISAPLVLHAVSLQILAQSDRIFIQKMCGNSDTAIYSLAYTYGLGISVITQAIANGWLPWFHDNYFAGNNEAIRKNVKKLIALGCYTGLACAAFAPEAIQILGGASYKDGLQCVPPIVLGIVCQYIYTQYVNIEMHLKKTKYTAFGTILAAVLNIVLNSLFIPIFGYVAAAYTTLICYLVLMLIHFIITRYLLHVVLYDDLYMFVAMAIMGVFVMIIARMYAWTVIRYVFILCGFITFIVFFRSDIMTLLKSIRKTSN